MHREVVMRRLVHVLLVIIALASSASAQPLVDRVPSDAILYIGWSGTDTLGAAYEKSHLAAVVKAANFKEIFEQTIPQLFAKLAQEQPEVLAMQGATMPLLKHAWQRPTAFYITAGVDRRGDFVPKLVILCDAGNMA